MQIEKFLERVQAAEAKGAKDVIIPLRDAKGVHNELTRLLLKLEFLQLAQVESEKVVSIEINGQTF